MNIYIPVFGVPTYYKEGDLIEYNDQVYVCDNPNASAVFHSSDWHHAIVDIYIDSAAGLDSNRPVYYGIRCLLAPDDFEILTFCEGLCAESVVTAVKDISDRFSVRTVYVGQFGTSYIRSMLNKMGYRVLVQHEPEIDETYIDRVARITKIKLGLKDENLVRLYALLALVKGQDVTLKDVHDAWAMNMNFKEPNPPHCYGHAHKSIVPFDCLKVEIHDFYEEHLEAIKEVVNTISK